MKKFLKKISLLSLILVMVTGVFSGLAGNISIKGQEKNEPTVAEAASKDPNHMYNVTRSNYRSKLVSGATIYISDIEDLLKLQAIVNGGTYTPRENVRRFSFILWIYPNREYWGNTSIWNGIMNDVYEARVGTYGAWNCEGVNFVIQNDINCYETSFVIGTEANPFKGNFVSNSSTRHKIYNYNTSISSSQNMGFFRETKNTTIENLEFNTTISNTYSSGNHSLGGLIGKATGTTNIKNVVFSGSVSGYAYEIGGFIGRAEGNVNILNSTIINTTISSAKSSAMVGSFIGFNNAITTIKNSYSTATLVGSNINAFIGWNQKNANNLTIDNVFYNNPVHRVGSVGRTSVSGNSIFVNTNQVTTFDNLNVLMAKNNQSDYFAWDGTKLNPIIPNAVAVYLTGSASGGIRIVQKNQNFKLTGLFSSAVGGIWKNSLGNTVDASSTIKLSNHEVFAFAFGQKFTLDQNTGYFGGLGTKTFYMSPGGITMYSDAGFSNVLTYSSLAKANKDGNYLFLGYATNKNALTPEIRYNGTTFSDWSNQYSNTPNGITMYAIFSKTNKVTFNSNGGSQIEQNGIYSLGNQFYSVSNSSSYTQLSNQNNYLPVPVKAGYNFLGYSTNADATSSDDSNTIFKYVNGKFDLNSNRKTLTSDTTLYAIWGVKTYSITLNANGGNHNSNQLTRVYSRTGIKQFYSDVSGKNLTSLYMPTKYGYNFLGYSTSNSATSANAVRYEYGRFEILSSWNPISDTTLYAVWEAVTTTVTFNANGGNLNGQTQTARISFGSVNYKSLMSSSIPSRVGYTFLGFADNSSTTTPNYLSYANGTYTVLRSWDKITNSTLYAVWTPNKYQVTLNANGGSWTTTPINPYAVYGTKTFVTQGNVSYYWTLPTTTSSYSFLGYSDSSNATVPNYIKNNNGSMEVLKNWDKATPSVLYAVWGRNSVVLNLNYGSTESGLDSYNIYPEFGTKTIYADSTGNSLFVLTGRNIPVRAGYNLLGFANTSTSTTPNVIIANSTNFELLSVWNTKNATVLYAVWARKSITLDANGGVHNSSQQIMVYPAYNSFSVYKNATGNEVASFYPPTKQNYKFLGYATSSGDVVIDYANNSFDVHRWMSSNESTIYAIWGRYEIVLDPNGGVITGDKLIYLNNNDASKKIYSSSTQDIFAILNKPTRPGYKFIGYATQPNASIPNFMTENLSLINPKTTETDEKVYAVWARNAVLLDANGGVHNSSQFTEIYPEYNSSVYYMISDIQDKTLASLYAPTRSGYFFMGYSDNSNAKVANYIKYDENSGFQYFVWNRPSAGQVLYAVWVADTNTRYNLEFYEMDTDGNYGSVPSYTSVQYGITDEKIVVTTTPIGFIIDSSRPENQLIDSSNISDNADIVPNTTAKVYLRRLVNRMSIKTQNRNALTIIGEGDYYFGQTGTITVTLNPGYRIEGYISPNLSNSITETRNEKGELVKIECEFTMREISVELDIDARFNNYTVTMDGNGGTTPNRINYNIELATFSIPASTRIGYTLKGWKVVGIGENAQVKSNNNVVEIDDVITSINSGSYGDISLQAVWEANKYTVRFVNEYFDTKTNANYSEVLQSLKAEYDSKKFFDGTTEVTEFIIPTRAGFVFKGYATAEEFVSIIFDTEFNIIQDWKNTNNETVYYAIWEAKNDTMFTIETYFMNADGTYNGITSNTEVRFGTSDSKYKATINDLSEYENYYLDTNRDYEITIFGDGSAKLEVYFIRDSYKLNILPNRFVTVKIDSNISSNKDLLGENEFFFGSSITLTATLSNGYKLTGWINDDNQNENSEVIYNFIMPIADKSLEPESEIIEYTIIIDKNNATLPVVDFENINYVVTDESTKLPVFGRNVGNIARDGYIFVGWKVVSIDDGKVFINMQSSEILVDDFITEIGIGSFANIVVRAEWKERTTEIILDTQSLSNGQLVSSLISSNGKLEKTSKQLIKYLSNEVLSSVSGELNTLKAVPGYIFDGWYLDKNATSMQIANQFGQLMPNQVGYVDENSNWVYFDEANEPSSVRLYAKWTPITYTIRFEFVGNNVTLIEGFEATQTFTYNGTKTLIKPYQRRGYDLTGWDGFVRDVETGELIAKVFSIDDVSKNTLTTVNNDELVFTTIWTPKKYQYSFVINSNETLIVNRDGRDITTGWDLLRQQSNYNSKLITELNVDMIYTYNEPLEFSSVVKRITKVGYKFVGWKLIYSENLSQEEIDNQYNSYILGINPGTLGTLKFKAEWEINPLTIVFHSGEFGNITTKSPVFNDGTVSKPRTVDINFTMNIGNSYNLITNDGNTYSLSRLGYDFVGWYTKPQGSREAVYVDKIENKNQDAFKVLEDIVVMGDGDERVATLYAHWTAKKYQIKLNLDGAVFKLVPNWIKWTKFDQTNQQYIAEFTYDQLLVLPNYSQQDYSNAVDSMNSKNLDKKGHYFRGWYKGIDVDGSPVGQALTNIDPENIGNVELFSYWVGQTYNIDYVTNGGKWIGSRINTYTYGDRLGLPGAESITNGHFTFGGWYTSPTTEYNDLTRTRELLEVDYGNKVYYALWITTYLASSEDEKPLAKVESTSGINTNLTLYANDLTADHKYYNETQKVLDNYDIKAFYDVLLKRNNISIVQPTKVMTVSLKLPSNVTNVNNLVVVAVGEDGSFEEIESEIKDGYIVFNTDFLTYFAIAESKDSSTTAEIPNWVWAVVGGSTMIIGLVSVGLYYTKRKKRSAL